MADNTGVRMQTTNFNLNTARFIISSSDVGVMAVGSNPPHSHVSGSGFYVDGDGNYDEPDGEIDMVRNPDGNMNVFEWPVNSETGEANKMMGTGTALSITEGTEFPETYVWTNGSGDCYQ